MSLRTGAIEEMGKALRREWEKTDEVQPLVSAALDALVGYLETHRAEWADWNAAACADADDGCNCVSDETVSGLLAVLKETE